jgi:hypothetical protein
MSKNTPRTTQNLILSLKHISTGILGTLESRRVIYTHICYVWNAILAKGKGISECRCRILCEKFYQKSHYLSTPMILCHFL